jgi:putative DNA primase/helicase
MNSRLDLTRNCTLEAYASSKMLPVEFLRSLGVETVANPYAPGRWALSIPYFNEDGSLHRNRIRAALLKAVDDDRRMLWDRQPEDHGTVLYGLNRLNGAEPTAFLEGESDTQTLWFNGYGALGLPGAGNFNPARDDRVFEGREIVAFPERDQGGPTLIRKLSRSVHRARIRVADLKGFKDVSEMYTTCPERFRSRFEAAVGKSVPLERVLQAMPQLDEEAATQEARGALARGALPNGFRYRRDGHIEHVVGKGDEGNPIWAWLCSPIEFLAVTRDGDQRAWGRLLRIKTPDGHWHQWPMAMELIAGDAKELRGMLLDLGLSFALGTQARHALIRLLSETRPQERALSVPHIGWHERSFVLPDEVFGDSPHELVVFQPVAPIKHAFRTEGTLEGWRTDVSAYAIANSRLGLAISAAFAPPLQQLMEVEGGGVHVRGPSTIGKTTLLHVGGSVWGGGGLKGYVRAWRATDNGLEAVALTHCDTLLALDELAEIDSNAAGKAAYMLANGQGKQRLGRSSEGRPVSEWRCIFLSTGEIGLAEKVAEDNRKRITAGQEVRVLDLMADAGKGLGVFDDLHGRNRPADLADHLKAASARHYGHPSREFLRRLVRDIEGAGDFVRRCMQEWLDKYCPADAEGQVRRAARRFALFAAAGELATAYGITGWPEGEARAATGECFSDWLHQRGGAEPAEVLRGIAQVRAFIARHGASRFASWDAPDENVRDRAGFRRNDPPGGVTFYFFPDAFREACAGLDPQLVAGALAERGMLDRGSDKLSKLVRIPRQGAPIRLYVVTPKLSAEVGDA